MRSQGKCPKELRERAVRMMRELRAVCTESIDHPTTRREYASRTTMQYTSLEGAVFGDVGQPEVVGLDPGEFAIDESAGGRLIWGLPIFWAARETGDPIASHHEFHCATRHRTAPPHSEVRVNSACTVGPTGVTMNLADDPASVVWRNDRADGGFRRHMSKPETDTPTTRDAIAARL